MKSNYKKLGYYIRPIDERNHDDTLGEDNLYGISVTKEFIISHANLVGVTFDGYKVVAPKQFAYIPDTSRRGEKIAISLNQFGKEIIVSSICSVFEIIDENELLPEYLMLWFMRPEFDRYARFMSNGSAREVFDWDCMCDVELPVPPIAKQCKIVHDYQVITDRIRLLRNISITIEAIINSVFKHLILENDKYDEFTLFEFGQYPATYSIKKMMEIVDVRDGTHDSPSAVAAGHKLVTSVHLNPYSVNKEDAYAISDADYNEINKRSVVSTWDILMSMIGTVGRLSLVTDNPVDYAIKNMALFKTSKLSHGMRLYLLSYLKSDITSKYLLSFLSGSTQSYVCLETLRLMPVIIPIENDLQSFTETVEPLYLLLISFEKEICCLESLVSKLYPKILKIIKQ